MKIKLVPEDELEQEDQGYQKVGPLYLIPEDRLEPPMVPYSVPSPTDWAKQRAKGEFTPSLFRRSMPIVSTPPDYEDLMGLGPPAGPEIHLPESPKIQLVPEEELEPEPRKISESTLRELEAFAGEEPPGEMPELGKNIVQNLKDLGMSTPFGMIAQFLRMPHEERMPAAKELGKYIVTRMGYEMIEPYTGIEKYKKYAWEQPISAAIDASIILSLAARGIGLTNTRGLRGVINYKKIRGKIPINILREAQATGDFSKVTPYAMEAFEELSGAERARIFRSGKAFQFEQRVPRFGERPVKPTEAPRPPTAEPPKPPPVTPPGEGKPVITTEIPPVEIKGKRMRVFPRYPEMMREIDAAIEKAPETAETVMEDGTPLKGWKPTITLKTDGEHNIINTKEALQAYKKALKGKEWTPLVKTFPGYPEAKPIAAQKEELGPLLNIKEKDWISDGSILAKTPAPKGAKKSEITGEYTAKQILDRITKPEPTKFAYNSLFTEELRATSKNPLPAEKDKVPLSIWKVGDQYAHFNQRKVQFVKKRFPDATWKYDRDGQMLVAYQNGEPVGLVKGIEPGVRAGRGELKHFGPKPENMDQAVEAGLIERPKPVIKPKEKPEALVSQGRYAPHVSAVSPEAIRRQKQGKFAFFDSKTGKILFDSSVDAVDRRPTKFQAKAWMDNRGRVTMLDYGEGIVRTQKPGIESRLKGAVAGEKKIRAKGPMEKSYGHASMGTYATGTEEYAAPLKAVIDLPEIVEIAKQLGKGFFPHIVKKIRQAGGLAEGIFYPKGLGKIAIRADTFKDVAQARAVLAHEVGHWIDYLPQRIMTRGNILGRIASLKKYMKKTLPRRPGAKEVLTEKDRRRLRYQARKLIETEYKDKWIDEEIIKELPISPDDVLAIWNRVEEALKTNSELYRFVQTLNTAEKKAIVRAALKGQVEERVKQFAKKVKEKTGKKIRVEPSKDLISKKYEELITKEIEKLRLFKADEIMDELKTLSRTWKPFDPSLDAAYTKYRYRSTELYADAVSALFNAPGLLRSTAPNFYEGFFNYLEAKPEVKKLYEQIQDDITAGKTDKNLTKRTYEGFKRGDDAYGLVLKKKYPLFDAMMRELVDAHWMIIKKVRQVGERNINPSENPRFKLEEMVYSGSEVEWMLGQTLQNVIKPLENVGLDWDNFGFYRLLKRVSSERAEVANPLGWHKDRAIKKLDAFKTEEWKGEKWEAVQKADKAFNEIREYLLDKAEKAGRYDRDFMEIMRGNVGDYVTFDVAHYIEKRHGAAPLAKIFPQIGTFQEIANPATATLIKDIVILKAVNRQIAAEAVTKFLQEHYPKEIRLADTKWNGRFHAIQDPPRGQNLGLIVYLKDGKPKGYYVDKWIADVFGQNPIEGMAISHILRWSAKPFRMLFTELNPGFWLFNIHRDYFRAAQMIPKAKITTFAKHWGKAVVPALKSTYGIPTDVVNEMLKDNMLISIEGVRGLSPQDREIERLLGRYRLYHPQLWRQKILKPFGDFFNLYTNIGRAIERMPKIGGYTFLKERFPDMPPELIGHIVRTRAGSPDFLRLGRAYPIYNNLLLFSNAIKEGYRGDYEAMVYDPAGFWYKKAKYIFLPKLLMYAASIGLLGSDTKRVYDGVTDYDMANYIVVPLGLTPNGSSVYLRVPTDEGSRLLGGVLIKGLQQERPQHLNNLFDYMAGQAPTINPAIENLISVVQYFAGHNPYDQFRGRYAIPEQVFRAHDERSHKAFVKWLANRSGSTIVYHFRSDDVKEVNRELEKILHYPFVSNIVGRFIKVSQAGIRQKIKMERELVKRETAREILDAKETLVKIINEEPLTDKDILALASKPDALDRNFVRGLARKYGNVMAEEVWSVFQTGSTEEKVRVLSKIAELDATGRTGEKYRWLWESKK